jgi:hypothetical protein
MALLSGYSSSPDHTSSSPSSHCIATPMKIAPGNPSIKFERDLTVGSKVMALLTRYSSTADQTSSSPSSYSIATPRKTASGNPCKNYDPTVGSKVMVLLS